MRTSDTPHVLVAGIAKNHLNSKYLRFVLLQGASRYGGTDVRSSEMKSS